jgi:hypothetical protein
MLEETATYANLPWSQIWQNYLQEQLTTGSTVSYQEIGLLWLALFPTLLQPLADAILTQFKTIGNSRQLYAQRFLTSLSLDLRDFRDLIFIQDTAAQAFSLLSSPKAEQRSTGLIILMGCLLHFQEVSKTDSATVAFIQQARNAALKALNDNNPLVRASAQDLLDVLPAQTV